MILITTFQVHKAENLLKGANGSHWKIGNAGEKQASVVIQLEKAAVIESVDIGNNGSAFIEVLVSRSSGHDVYEVNRIMIFFVSGIPDI